jgi:hypothetical protein
VSPASTPPDRGATRAKRWGLGAALVVTCAAALWPVEDEPAEARRTAATARLQGGVAVAMAQSPRPTAATATSASAPVAAARSLPDRSQWSEVRVYRDPFDSPEGLEPPAPKPLPKAAAAPSPAASAPPPPALSVPWSYAGRLLVPGQPDAVLLHDGPRTVPLAVGATLGDWRLEADRGQHLDFIHLPTGASVVLPLPQ